MADLAAAAERFQRDTAAHVMTVLHDDGLYRHLRFRRVVVLRYLAECQQCMPVLPVPFESDKDREVWQAKHQGATGHEVRLRLSHVPPPAPGKRSVTSADWFDLVTWPGSLTVSGDCGAFTFARLDDMFEFFRGSQINPGYWAEKVLAADPHGVTAYCPGKFRQLVADYVAESAGDWPGLAASVENRFFGAAAEWNTEYEHDAREALEHFEHGVTFTAACSCGACLEGATDPDAQAWRVSHIRSPYPGGHSTKVTRVDGFRFCDTWEWDLSDYNWQFLWCCHAIQWGIRQYDQQKVPAKATADA